MQKKAENCHDFHLMVLLAKNNDTILQKIEIHLFWTNFPHFKENKAFSGKSASATFFVPGFLLLRRTSEKINEEILKKVVYKYSGVYRGFLALVY